MKLQSEAIQQFGVIQGGKEDIPITKADPKGPEVIDWLRNLGDEARFVSRGKHNRGCFLENYGIAQIMPKAIMLYNFMPMFGANPYVWVDSFKFSQDNILVEILENPPQEEESKNGQNHLSLPEPREVNDGHEGPA